MKFQKVDVLIILDTLRRFHQGDENNSGVMSKVIGRLEGIAALILDVRLYFYTIQTKGTATMGVSDDIQQANGNLVASWLIIYGGNLIWQA